METLGSDLFSILRELPSELEDLTEDDQKSEDDMCDIVFDDSIGINPIREDRGQAMGVCGESLLKVDKDCLDDGVCGSECMPTETELNRNETVGISNTATIPPTVGTQKPVTYDGHEDIRQQALEDQHEPPSKHDFEMDQKLLEETLVRTSSLMGQVHVMGSRDKTYGGSTSDQGINIHTSRGARNIVHVTRETDNENDGIMEDLLEFVKNSAHEELVDEFPDLNEPGKASLLIDKRSQPPYMDMACHDFGNIDLGKDLSRQLTPDITHWVDHLASDMDNPEITAMVFDIKEILQRRCNRNEQCAYTSYFFTELSRDFTAGRVVYSDDTLSLIMDIPQLLSSDKEKRVYIEMLHKLFHPRQGETNLQHTLCICCLVLVNSNNQLMAMSGGPAQRQDMTKENVFLLQREDQENFFDVLKEVDYETQVINVHGCSVAQLSYRIDFSNYAIEKNALTCRWEVRKLNAPSPNLCLLCRANNHSMCLQPCGHLGVCEICAEGLKKCPFCRSDITEAVNCL
ncbi:PREDICTED: uncharacterized protein LOC109473304 [Branchiostoma belcheri]|uniref:Uncharacterized protein LOC109473304 n=1 Tax=Branchiostoma belcheri TaxID=7741 RepID=A0A6P4ZGE9_BRABE|nr:PREDICTED: uncharacterized protein LOC109473304 [Branchiostoma belcheri]